MSAERAAARGAIGRRGDERAAELLSRLRLGPVPLETVEPKVGAALLLRTGLAKFAGKGVVALVAMERRRGLGER